MKAQERVINIVIKDGDYILEMWEIIVLCIAFVVGIVITVTAGFIIRRLHELHTQHNVIDGTLFITVDGEIYSEFGISIEELSNKDYILMKIDSSIKEGGS